MKNIRSGKLVVGVIATVIMAMTISTAFAGGSPHFIKSATDAYIHMMGCLHADFKEVGLSSGSVETIVLKGTAAVTFVTVNKGGNEPQASNKQTYVVEVRKSGEFVADKSGNITGFVCIPPPTAEEVGLKPAKGQTAVFVSIVYTNVMIVDETSGAKLSIPGTFSYLNPDYAP